MDAYAPFTVGRRYDLSPAELVLVAVTLLADWRTYKWTGTYAELVEVTRLGRRAVPAAVRLLVALGLLEEVRPFHSGVADAMLRVVVYRELVPSALPPIDAEVGADPREVDEEVRAGFAPGSRGVLAESREPESVTSADAAPLMNNANKEEEGSRGDVGVVEQEEEEGTARAAGFATEHAVTHDDGKFSVPSSRALDEAWALSSFQDWMTRPFFDGDSPERDLAILTELGADRVPDWGLKIAHVRKELVRRASGSGAVERAS